MLYTVHESESYQDFLISEQRRGIISPELYDAFIPEFKENINILDFGCGLGYASVYYSERFQDESDFHIYGCDYQVDVLDLFWKRIADNKFKNITLFHMPNRSRLHFPKWIPQIDHFLLSLTLGATDNPVDILMTIKPMLTLSSRIHILEWDKSKSHRDVDTIVPQRYRLSLDKVEYYLKEASYDVVKHYKTQGPYFALTAKMRPETSPEEIREKQLEQFQKAAIAANRLDLPGNKSK